MFPNLLFTMSLAGSTVFLLYILAYPFAKEYNSSSVLPASGAIV